MIYIILALISSFILLIARFKAPELVRFEIRPFLKFLGIMVVLSLFRYWIIERQELPLHVFEIMLINPLNFLAVFWEDVFVVLPVMYLVCKNYSKFLYIPAAAISTYLFAIGHLYQGIGGFLFAVFFMLLSFHYSKKYGILTTAACHVVYDLMTWGILFLILSS